MVVTVVTAQLGTSGSSQEPTGSNRETKVVSADERLHALSRAQVWTRPTVPPSTRRMSGSPAQPTSIDCKFKLTELGGTTPKFDCVLDNGDQIRVKYGETPEIQSEVAATRLLQSLGFGADDVMLVKRLRCYGCPASPFMAAKAVEITGTTSFYEKLVNFDGHQDFEWVAVERKHPARPIVTERTKGWAFYELDSIDHKKGGAPRAHVDALRLMAVFLAHWDNKSENQRLVCLSDDDSRTGGRCRKPFAMLQDVGSAFGPRKVDLEAWERTPIWANRLECTASMATLPARGGTFPAVKITDPGRRLLGSLLGQLDDRQLADLFSGARFHEVKAPFSSERSTVPDWVRVFKLKVREIIEGPACPQ